MIIKMFPSLSSFIFDVKRGKRNHLIMKLFNYFAVRGDPGHANKSFHEVLTSGKRFEIADGKRDAERLGRCLEKVDCGK